MIKIDNDLVAHIRRSQRERQERAEFFNSTRDIVERATRPDAATFAAAVIRAGLKRRNELKEPPTFSNDKHGKFARALVNAARKARNEDPI